MAHKKILVVDDDPHIREVISFALEKAEMSVTLANDGKQALNIFEKNPTDLIVLDINMPEMDGIEVTKTLKETYPEVKILILSMYNRSEFIKTLISAGADGYILKNSGRDILFEAIHSLSKGKRYFSKEILDNLIDSYVESDQTIDIARIELSDREKDVVRLIVAEKSTTEIAEELFLSTHTINSHRKSILNKLQVKNAAGIFRYAVQTGIVKGFDL